MKEHVIICGLGHIGFRSFELLQQLGIKVAVVTDKTSDDWRKKVENAGGLFIMGDARNDALLVQAGVTEASAILAVTDQDLVNVSIVMDSRRLNPKIRIVCRLFDTSLGKHISEAFGVNQVFSTSELAAPAFIGAYSHEGILSQLSFLGHQATLTESPKKDTQTVFTLANGDEVEHHLSIKLSSRVTRLTPSVRNKIINWIFRPSLVKFRRITGFISVAILFSALIVKSQMSLSWIDAFYFVTATITTVGYGDFNFSAAAPEMKIFGILLMLVGATGLAILFSTVTEALLSERLSSLFGGRTVPKGDHVILIGAGHIGLRIAEQLSGNNIPLVVIENDSVGRFPADIKRKVAVVEGDARNADTLNRANAATAKAILVVSDDDILNLSVVLSAHRLHPDIKTITRVFDADLGEKLQTKLSVTKILSVSRIAAPYFVAAAITDKVTAATRWRNHLIILSENSGNLKNLNSIQIAGVAQPLYIGATRLGQV